DISIQKEPVQQKAHKSLHKVKGLTLEEIRHLQQIPPPTFPSRGSSKYYKDTIQRSIVAGAPTTSSDNTKIDAETGLTDVSKKNIPKNVKKNKANRLFEETHNEQNLNTLNWDEVEEMVREVGEKLDNPGYGSISRPLKPRGPRISPFSSQKRDSFVRISRHSMKPSTIVIHLDQNMQSIPSHQINFEFQQQTVDIIPDLETSKRHQYIQQQKPLNQIHQQQQKEINIASARKFRAETLKKFQHLPSEKANDESNPGGNNGEVDSEKSEKPSSIFLAKLANPVSKYLNEELQHPIARPDPNKNDYFPSEFSRSERLPSFTAPNRNYLRSSNSQMPNTHSSHLESPPMSPTELSHQLTAVFNPRSTSAKTAERNISINQEKYTTDVLNESQPRRNSIIQNKSFRKLGYKSLPASKFPTTHLEESSLESGFNINPASTTLHRNNLSFSSPSTENSSQYGKAHEIASGFLQIQQISENFPHRQSDSVESQSPTDLNSSIPPPAKIIDISGENSSNQFSLLNPSKMNTFKASHSTETLKNTLNIPEFEPSRSLEQECFHHLPQLLPNSDLPNQIDVKDSTSINQSIVISARKSKEELLQKIASYESLTGVSLSNENNLDNIDVDLLLTELDRLVEIQTSILVNNRSSIQDKTDHPPNQNLSNTFTSIQLTDNLSERVQLTRRDIVDDDCFPEIRSEMVNNHIENERSVIYQNITLEIPKPDSRISNEKQLINPDLRDNNIGLTSDHYKSSERRQSHNNDLEKGILEFRKGNENLVRTPRFREDKVENPRNKYLSDESESFSSHANNRDNSESFSSHANNRDNSERSRSTRPGSEEEQLQDNENVQISRNVDFHSENSKSRSEYHYDENESKSRSNDTDDKICSKSKREVDILEEFGNVLTNNLKTKEESLISSVSQPETVTAESSTNIYYHFELKNTSQEENVIVDTKITGENHQSIRAVEWNELKTQNIEDSILESQHTGIIENSAELNIFASGAETIFQPTFKFESLSNQVEKEQQKIQVYKINENSSNSWIAELIENKEIKTLKQSLSVNDLLETLEYPTVNDNDQFQSEFFDDGFENIRISYSDNSQSSLQVNDPSFGNFVESEVVTNKIENSGTSKIDTNASNFEELLTLKERLYLSRPIRALDKNNLISVFDHATIEAEAESDSEFRVIQNPINEYMNKIHERIWSLEFDDSESTSKEDQNFIEAEPVEVESEEEFDEIEEMMQYPMYTGYGFVMDSRKVIKRVPKSKNNENLSSETQSSENSVKNSEETSEAQFTQNPVQTNIPQIEITETRSTRNLEPNFLLEKELTQDSAIKMQEPSHQKSKIEDTINSEIPLLTFEQKVSLSEAITLIPPEAHDTLFEIIRASPKYVEESLEYGDIEMDIDTLDPMTLYVMNEFVKRFVGSIPQDDL
ncbi:hypothetical protein HK096_000749, partial [Nowakowskiella sp. JEL0078]